MDRREIARLRARRAVQRAGRHKRYVNRALRKATVIAAAVSIVILVVAAIVLEATRS
ncbi:hypothetical protein [Nonomuraea sp. NPDC048916]|uniref:hypothetical protein n=1 Tax=Nonomuraea sp. NPDC048916 TaxID=3154232 RepID=UPI0033E42C03